MAKTIIGNSILPWAFALLAGCNGSSHVNPLGLKESQTHAMLKQSIIWQKPEVSGRKGEFSTDEDGNQYYVYRSSVTSFLPDGNIRWEYQSSGSWFRFWDIYGQHIRIAEHVSN